MMNSDAICHPGDLRDTSAKPTFAIGTLFACMRNGMRVARQARRLYAMNDETLQHHGLSREDIPAHLASQF